MLNDMWLIIAHELDSWETKDYVQGVFCGNIVEILYENFAKDVNLIPATKFSVYSLELLIKMGENKILKEDNVFKKHVLLKDFDNRSFAHLDEEYWKQEVEKFAEQHPELNITSSLDGLLFNSLDKKINNELDSLSEETKEYIRKYGI